MKTKINGFIRAACILTLGMASFCLVPAYADGQDGGQEGNGGDSYSQEFTSLGYDILGRISQRPIEGVDQETLFKALASTKVYSTNDTLYDKNHQEVEAVNYPVQNPPRIMVQRAAWDRMEKEKYKRSFLVLHEYLGILGIDDSKYEISAKIDSAKVCSRSEKVRKFIEDRFGGISCDRITVQDLARIVWLNFRFGADERYAFQTGDFEYLSSVSEMDIFGGTVDFPSGLFSGMSGLKKMNLSAMNIDKIAPHTFVGLSSLQSLFMVKVEFMQPLEEETFFGMEKLTHLGFDYSVIPAITKGTFIGLSSLTDIRFYESSLNQAPPAGCFLGLESMKVLHFDTQFYHHRLKRNQFLGLSSLEWLGVSGWGSLEVDEIEDGAFEGLTSLKELSLRILSRDLNPSIFDSLQGLEKLWIQTTFSALSKFPDDYFKTRFPNLKGVTIYEEEGYHLVPSLLVRKFACKSLKPGIECNYQP